MILMETLVAHPLRIRERPIRDRKKPPKYSLIFVRKMKNHFNLPKEYTKQDFMKYFNAYSRIDWKEHP